MYALGSSSSPVSAVAPALSLHCPWPVEGQGTYTVYRTQRLMPELCRDPGSPRAVCINDMVRKPAELPSSNVTLKSVSISLLTSSKYSSNHSLT